MAMRRTDAHDHTSGHQKDTQVQILTEECGKSAPRSWEPSKQAIFFIATMALSSIAPAFFRGGTTGTRSGAGPRGSDPARKDPASDERAVVDRSFHRSLARLMI